MTHEPEGRDAASVGPPRSPARRWPLAPAAILAVGVAAMALLRFVETSESMAPLAARLEAVMTPFLSRLIVVGLTMIALALWFVAFAPISRAGRLRTGAILLGAVVLLLGMFRIDRVSGDIVPRLRFRWTPRADEALPAAPDQAADAVADLTTTTPDDYPQFLGPNRLATLPELNLARDWSERPPKLLWRQPIGAAWSSFAIVGHFGVTQEQRGQEELVTCYDLDNGKLLWSHATPERFSERIAGIGPRATPTVYQGKVYALGAKGDFVCLDGATGKVLWQHQILKENHALMPQWGKSCSPLVHENLVIVSAGGTDGKSLIAYDRETGERVWSGGDDFSSYSSPTLMTLAGQPQIVILNAMAVTAHDPADGHVLWRQPWPSGEDSKPNVAQPIAVGDDRILLTKGYGVGSSLWQVNRAGNGWQIETVWNSRNLKTKFTNAVVREGFAYGLDEGILCCVDVSSGAKKWKQGKYGHGQVLLIGDLLLVQSEYGDVALVEAEDKKFHELTRIAAVGGQSWNCPALSGRRLVVRSDEEVACYELPLADAAQQQ